MQHVKQNFKVHRFFVVLIAMFMILGICSSSITADAAGPFNDVSDPTKYYYQPVYWAAEQEITQGTSASAFSPDQTCTRGQIVTFLWRSAGSPAAEQSYNPFVDVQYGSYYYNAVLWAVENGITKGTSDTRFSPDASCTRGQIVTFLYRYAGSPGVSGSNSFQDVPQGEYYYNAVLWAVGKGITNGTKANLFSPAQGCTRAQVVTFLYRYYHPGESIPAVRTKGASLRDYSTDPMPEIPDHALDITDYGASVNDSEDDAPAFYAAMKYIGTYDDESGELLDTIYVPSGKYLIDLESRQGIWITKSNLRIIMEPDAILEVRGTGLDYYNVFAISNVENVTIYGGVIDGERYRHNGSSGEDGHGIGIYDGRKITISHMKISSNWGDGIYLGTGNNYDTLYGCDDICIEYCEIRNNRRSNISITDADNVRIESCLIENAGGTGGTAPQCGINIEPNMLPDGTFPLYAVCRNITVHNTVINTLGKGDRWAQFMTVLTHHNPYITGYQTCDNLEISSCTLNGDCSNNSGTNARITDTIIRGTFYDRRGTILDNVEYEDKWWE